MKVTLIQHPVGQGGLFSGNLNFGDSSIHWIYDCGSNQTPPLRREINRVSRSGHVDILFLSHLDSDHINGIDRLLLRTEVDEVVLPYLQEVDRALLVARDLQTDDLNSSFLDFAEDPARWFIARGVGTVTFIHGSDDGEDSPDDGPDFPPDRTEGHGHRKVTREWSRPPIKRSISAGHTIQEMDTHATVLIRAGSRVLDWALCPYAQRPAASRMKSFRQAVHRAFGFSASSVRKIVAAVKTASGRNTLRECYDQIWEDHNLVSMALYSGPTNGSPSWHVARSHSPLFNNATQAIGWLCTGDANLSGVRRRQAFLRHYQRLLPLVDTLVLPHHGAASSFHKDVLLKLPVISAALASAGPNGYGHPHPAVRKAVRLHFNDPLFHKVGKKSSSRYFVMGRC